MKLVIIEFGSTGMMTRGVVGVGAVVLKLRSNLQHK